MLKKINRILPIIMIAVLVMVPSHVSAIDKIDLEQQVRLTVNMPDYVAGMELDLYKVADNNEWAEFTLTEDFADYDIIVNGLDSEGWKSLAEKLSGYADADGIMPLMSKSVSAESPAEFGVLEQGLYLVDGESVNHEGKVYTPTPFLISLPNRAADSETWDYNVQTVLKYGITDAIPESGTEEDQGGEEPPVEDNDREEPDKPDEPDGDKDEKLPQTGVLWWPVPVMIAIGLLLVIIGVLKRRGAESEG